MSPDPLERFKALTARDQQLIQALKGLELEQQKIRYNYQLELLQLKKKYGGLLDPMYHRRMDIVSGLSGARVKELELGELGLRKVLGKSFQPLNRSPLPSSAEGIGNFWLAAWMNHPGLSRIVADRDTAALEYLVNIRYSYFTGQSTAPAKTPLTSYAMVTAGPNSPSPSTPSRGDAKPADQNLDIGYKLCFDFKRNPYFTDETLEKLYYFKKDQVDEFGELMYSKSVGCTIHWKSGMDLTAKKSEWADQPTSFFEFFSPRSLPSDEEIARMTDEEYGAFLDEVEGDFECGEDIRDEIIPYALTYLLDPPDVDDESDEEEDGEEGDEDEDEEDEDE